MPITFKCTGCGTSMTVPDQHAGKQGKCKKCGAMITAPAAKAAPAKAAPAKAAPAKAGAKPTVVAASDGTLSEATSNEEMAETEEDEGPPKQGLKQGAVKFKCPKCKVELKVPLHLAGKQGKCRKCGGTFVSPVPEVLKQARAKLVAAAEKPSLRDAFSVVKVRCSCGVTSAILRGKGQAGDDRCPACDKPLAAQATS
jgi:hypothetical protein